MTLLADAVRLGDLGEREGLRDRERELPGLDQLADLGERGDRVAVSMAAGSAAAPGKSSDGGIGGVTNTRLGQVYAVAGQDGPVRCRFCDKHHDQVTGMAATSPETGDEASGPAAICGECLSLCVEIIAEELT